MIRGVNRQVIEVNKTGSIYFERALLVVNPIFADTGKNILETEARDIMATLAQPPNASERRIRTLKRWSALLAAGGVGAVVSTLILLLA